MDRTSIYRYFRGEASREEEERLLEWVEASEENRRAYLNERMLFDATLFASQPVAEKRGIKVVLRRIARIAAILIIAVSGKVIIEDYLFHRRMQPQTVAVPAGQRAQITLPDGTHVWLNAKSTLTYAADFGESVRSVNLDGEAYFEVAKDRKHPFFVETEMNKVRVVGTSFNICAYNGSGEFEATLTEGIVDIYSTQGDKVLARLQKDEFFANYNGKYKKTVLPSYEYLRWKEGLYCFDDASFAGILTRLEKYYNVNITVADSLLLDYTGCTGKFREQDGIEHILRVLAKDHPFSFHINEAKDSITIYR
ncbi:MAG: FecR family protein [Mediterranea sp.]|jgi:ferric-dicitrate binding protein FerR (iron transport regulator)|nr:FecR family protein [Mediterranea sp.]